MQKLINTMKKLIRFLKEHFYTIIANLVFHSLTIWYVPVTYQFFFIMGLGVFIWFIVDKYLYEYSWIFEIPFNIFLFSLAVSLFIGRTTFTEWSVDIYRNMLLIPFWEWSIWG